MCQAGTLRAESTCVVLSVGLAAEPQHTQGRRLKAGRSSWWDLDISNGKVSKDGQGVSHTQRLQTHWGPPSSPEGQADPASSLGLTASRGPRGRACVYLTKEGKRISGTRLACEDSLEMSVLAADWRRLGRDEL